MASALPAARKTSVAWPLRISDQVLPVSVLRQMPPLTPLRAAYRITWPDGLGVGSATTRKATVPTNLWSRWA